MIGKYLNRPTRAKDRGLSLVELLVVIAMSTGLLMLVVIITISITKHDAINRARQSRIDTAQQTSVWLGDALSHAGQSLNESLTLGTFTTATANEVWFFTALPVEGSDDLGPVVRVSLVLSGQCFGRPSSKPAVAGTLRRCVQDPIIDADGNASFCQPYLTTCPDYLFHESDVARNVKASPSLFTYYIQGSSQPSAFVYPWDLNHVTGVGFKATICGDPDRPNSDVCVTSYRRHAVRGWKRL
ncbi:MAG: hypothetical protein LBJ08_07065 [Bifidobacteriaceae bacterium]|jgi:competence protein ComGC|nr:hypothetical protein [Bifidobacteriaceae bacterium]